MAIRKLWVKQKKRLVFADSFFQCSTWNILSQRDFIFKKCILNPLKRECSTWNILFFWVQFPVFTFLFFGKINAQNTIPTAYLLKIEAEKSDEIQAILVDFAPVWELKIPDTLAFIGAYESEIAPALLQHTQRKGFLIASIEANPKAKDSSDLSLFLLGEAFTWVDLHPKGTIERAWLRAADLDFGRLQSKRIELKSLFEIEKILLEQSENRGYPFAKVYLDSLVEPEKGRLSALFVLEKGNYFTFESLDFTSPVRIPKRYLSSILSIQEGEMFSRQKVLDIENRLAALPFLQLKESPKVRFNKETAQVRLVFEEKKANRFDFLIGLLPQGGGTNRTILTGSLDGLFYNALNQGERFELKLERLRPETQRADLSLESPYLLGLPFGSAVSLHLHKRDSTFLDANGRLGLAYLFQNGDQIQVFWDNKSSSLLTVDTSKIIQNRRLPEALDYRRNGLGLAWRHSTLDYLLNPRSGLLLDFSVSVGQNRVLKNAQIEKISTGDTDFGALYDALNRSATRFQSEQKVKFHQPIRQRSTVLLGLQGFSLFSNTPIYRNEQYRLGGTNSIRGFDEESIFSTRSVFGTLEYRLLLSRDAHLAAFSDYGYFENSTQEVQIQQWLLSFGVGMTLQTGSGQFNISVANGKAGPNPFDFRATKFHLGYRSIF